MYERMKQWLEDEERRSSIRQLVEDALAGDEDSERVIMSKDFDQEMKENEHLESSPLEIVDKRSLEVGKITELVNVTLGDELKHLDPEQVKVEEILASGGQLLEVDSNHVEGMDGGEVCAVWEEEGGHEVFFLYE